MYRRRAALAVFALTLVGCGALKDALTSHTEVAARVGSHELSSAKLADMMHTAQMPPRKDLAAAVATLWVNYHLLAEASAKSDTLGEPAVADQAMWAQIAQRRLQKLLAEVHKGAPALDAAALQKAYDGGQLLAVRHILILGDKASLKPNQIDSVRRVADNVRRQVTPANFVAMVKKYSGDPGSKDSGGEYLYPTPALPQMVPEFDKASRALKPGEISDPVQTAYGFHIIMRETYPEAKVKFDSTYSALAEQKAESTFIAALEKGNDVKVKDGAALTVRSILQNLDQYRTNRTVLATSRAVDLRASRVASWIAAFPPQARIRQQLQQVPDSLLPEFLKSLMRNELLLRSADSAKITLDPAELAQLRSAFHQSVQNSLSGLGILPSQLADSAKRGDRGAIASTRVDDYLARLLKNQAQFVDVSEPVSIALRQKYDGTVNESGLDRAVTLATAAQAKADSATNAALPPSAVPTPGAPSPGAPSSGATPPAGGAPKGAKKP